MIELAVYIDRGATLARFDQIAKELTAAGLEVAVRMPSVGVIVVRCEDRDRLADIRRIRDIAGVKERAPA